MRRAIKCNSGRPATMELFPIQDKWLLELYQIVWEYKFGIMRQEARCGKTPPVVQLVNMLLSHKDNANCLVITTKPAVDGWVNIVRGFNPKVTFWVIHHEALKTLGRADISKTAIKRKTRLDRIHRQKKDHILNHIKPIHQLGELEEVDEWYESELYSLETEVAFWLDFKPDFVVIDECHLWFSGFPYTGTARYDLLGNRLKENSEAWQRAKALIGDSPVVAVSATPTTEGYEKLYNVLKLSKEVEKTLQSPQHYLNVMPDLTTKKPDTLSSKFKRIYEKYCVSGTLAECGIGFQHSLEIVRCELSDDLKEFRHTLLDRGIATLYKGNTTQVVSILNENAEISPSKFREAVIQLDGGTIKDTNGKGIILDDGKVKRVEELIKDKGATPEEVCIFYHYRAEYNLLKKAFPNTLLKSASQVEGFDLYLYKFVVVYSFSKRGSKWSQMVNRMCNRKRTTPIVVYAVVEDNGAMEQVIELMRSKHNRTKESFMGDLKEADWVALQHRLIAQMGGKRYL